MQAAVAVVSILLMQAARQVQVDWAAAAAAA
jgi:hypothetical protein